MLSKLFKGVEAGVDKGVDAPDEGVVVKSTTGVKPFDTVRTEVIVAVQSAFILCMRGKSSRAALLASILMTPKFGFWFKNKIERDQEKHILYRALLLGPILKGDKYDTKKASGMYLIPSTKMQWIVRHGLIPARS